MGFEKGGHKGFRKQFLKKRWKENQLTLVFESKFLKNFHNVTNGTISKDQATTPPHLNQTLPSMFKNEKWKGCISLDNSLISDDEKKLKCQIEIKKGFIEWKPILHYLLLLECPSPTLEQMHTK